MEVRIHTQDYYERKISFWGNLLFSGNISGCPEIFSAPADFQGKASPQSSVIDTSVSHVRCPALMYVTSCWEQVLFLAASVCVSFRTKSQKLLIGNWCNLVGMCPMVNARSGWKLVTFDRDIWPWELFAYFSIHFHRYFIELVQTTDVFSSLVLTALRRHISYREQKGTIPPPKHMPCPW